MHCRLGWVLDAQTGLKCAFHVYSTVIVDAVVFMGRHQLQPSLKWMGAFWLSIAGK